MVNDGSQVSGDLGENRLTRLHRVLEHCIRRRMTGEQLPDDQVIAEHPDLMPELANELRKLRRIQDARKHAVHLDAVGSEPSGTSDDALPDFELPGYQLVRELSRGGQAVVYQAIHRATKRKVAVKVMHQGPFAGRRDKARFDREVEVLAQLNHANVVTIHDSGSVSGTFYFVMDYISGQPLDRWADSGQRSIEELLRLFGVVCEAVNAAHLQGVIHRDLKPSNILVDPQAQPHVLDFGLAKVVGSADISGMTLTGQFVGSTQWASPEQAEGVPQKIDIRTDVYSLGMILYRMLTGKFPYEVVGNLRDVLDRIINAEPVRPSTIKHEINEEIETIVLKCLAKERERRYQSAGELARDIRRYLSGEPIEAKRDSMLYVLRKHLRRYRLSIAAVAGFVLLAGTSSILAWALYAGERRISQRERTLAIHETSLREDVQRAQAATQADLYRALVGRASALRLARRPGYREEVWRCLREAAALDVPDRDLDEIRDEVLACLGDFVGMPPSEGGHSHPPATQLSSQSLPMRLQAILEQEGGAGEVRWAAPKNGSILAVVRWDPQRGWVIGLWSAGGEPRGHVVPDLEFINDLQFTSDGEILLVGGEGGFAQYRMADLSLIGMFGGGAIRSVAVHPEGHLAATSTTTGVDLWSLGSNRLVAHYQPQGTQWVTDHVAFSIDGRLLVGQHGDRAEQYQAWPMDGTPERRLLAGHRGGISFVSFDPYGRLLASASKDALVKVWDVSSGRLLATCTGHQAPVETLGFGSDGLLASADTRGEILIWEAGTARLVCRASAGFHVRRIRFSDDGQKLVVAGAGGLMILPLERDAGAVRVHSPLPLLDGKSVLDVSLNPEANRFWFVTRDGRLHVMELNADPRMLSVEGSRYALYPLHVLAQGSLVSFVTPHGHVGLCDWAGNVVAGLTAEPFSEAGRVMLAHQSGRIAALTGNNQIVIYDLAADQRLFSLPPEPGVVWTMDWNRDGSVLALGLSDGELACWNLEEVRHRLAVFGSPIRWTTSPLSQSAFAADPAATQSSQPSPAQQCPELVAGQIGQPVLVFDNTGTRGVVNGGSPPCFTVKVPYTLQLIWTYHWNNGRGAPAGTVRLRSNTGEVFGPFQTRIKTGDGGVPANWIVNPNVTIPAGTYTIEDSDPATWSSNWQSYGRGFARIEGWPVSSAP